MMFDFSEKKKAQVYDNLRSVMQICIDRIVNLNKDGKGKRDAEALRDDFAYAFHCMDLCSEYRWIPCSERLPENDVPVNIVWTNHNPESYYSHIKDKQFTATGVCHNGKWHWYSCVCVDYLHAYGKCEVDEVDEEIEILFWMPLPEPPEVV